HCVLPKLRTPNSYSPNSQPQLPTLTLPTPNSQLQTPNPQLPMYIEDEELRELYRTSAPEHIQAIESALMQLEKQPQNPVVLKDL
ncbi:MAG: hypothetical protein LH474_04150, partial [Chamaesiphon sp.]|nr:hypothetical protein [Chamaesiphon sp.]